MSTCKVYNYDKFVTWIEYCELLNVPWREFRDSLKPEGADDTYVPNIVLLDLESD